MKGLEMEGFEGQITWALNTICLSMAMRDTVNSSSTWSGKRWALQIGLNLNHNMATFVLHGLEQVSYFL